MRADFTSLRERIAAAIAGVDDWGGVTDPMILADAVIAELNLSIAVEYPSVDGKRHNFMLAGHYVTDWIATREPRSAEKLGLTGDGA